MNVGDKIRELRVAKLMTQAELAGTQITRNMLSCIENGSAQPSLSTLCYIAGRLNVPAGFLLAEEGDEIAFRKMNRFANIKRAYIAKDWRGCRSLCQSGCPKPDDEISLLLAECDTGIAVEEFLGDRLHSSRRFFDEALEYAKKTVYFTGHIKAEARAYFRYMERISPTLYSNALEEDEYLPVASNLPIAKYLDALEMLDRKDESGAIAFCSDPVNEGGFYVTHLQARMRMEQGAFADAMRELTVRLDAEEPLCKVDLYAALCDLEICCRETEDYKGAYRYANEKIRLLEQLLKDVAVD